MRERPVIGASPDVKGWTLTPLDRAAARLWLSLPFVRRSRRMGISTRRMLVLYVLVNWWFILVIEALLGLVR